MHKAIKTVLIMALAVSAASAVRAQTLTGTDVNYPGMPGSTTLAAGKYTIVGGGGDIWATADTFHYAYMPITGDFDYVTQVESLVGNSGDGGWSKVELMARKSDPSLTPSDDWPNDPFIANMVNRPTSDTANGAPAGVNNRGPQWRCHEAGEIDPVDPTITYEGQATWTTPNPTYPPLATPGSLGWVRLERVGSTFWMSTSDTGAANSWNYYTPFAAQGWNTAGSWPAGVDNPGSSGLDSTFTGPGWPAQILLGIAVTAHNDADVSTAVVSSFGPYANKVPIQITQQPPATINMAANGVLTLAAAATGDPVHFQWLKDGNPIPATQANPGPVNATYVKQLVQVADSGTYVLRCFGAGQTSVDSTPCVVTITLDTTPPTMVKAVGSASFTEATITFSEPVTAPTATTLGNYSIAGLALSGTPVLSADGFTVVLTTARQAEGVNYVITVNNVRDTGANPIVAGSTIPFKSFSFLTGQAMRQQWNNAGPHNSLTTFIQYRIGYEAAPEEPIAPTLTAFETGFECPTAWGFGDNYGGRLSGWFIPPTTGDYVFYCCSDDSSFLFLSSDASPANKRKLAREPSWENSRSWKGSLRRGYVVGATDSDNGRDPGADGYFLNQSDTCPDGEWGSTPGSPVGGATIHLTQGQKYYIEGLWQDGTGGDGFGATYRLATEDEATVIVDNTATRISGALIGTYADTSTLPPRITTHPSGTPQLNPGESVTFTVVAENPAAGDLTYQWTLNGRDIAGATGTSYTIASATIADMGQYRVKVSNANGTLVSNDNDSYNPPIVVVNGTGLYAIEGEDFDYNSGQSMPEASVMPYYGGAYAGLSAVRGVDYMNDDDPGNNMANGFPVYRWGGDLGTIADDPNTGATIGAEQPGGLFAITRGGQWTMTNNFKLGWTGSGNWGNYTRTFPTPAKSYHVFMAAGNDSYGDGGVNGALGKVTAGVGTATQTVEPIGVFYAQGTGNWSRNNLTAMTESNTGPRKTVELGGTVTLRWNYSAGDAEYLIFYPETTTVVPAVSASSNAQGQPVITFTGVLYGSSTVNGTYTPVAGATSPFTVTGGAGTATFYRAGSQ